MPKQPDHTLPDIVSAAVEEIDPGGDGFRTNDLAEAIARKVRDGCGHLSENGKQLMMDGARYRAQRWQPARRKLMKKVGTNQHDMIELDPGFAFFVQEVIGTDETRDAERRALLKMTLREFEAALRMHERKAAETEAKAREMRRILHVNPQWRAKPHLTLAELLGITDAPPPDPPSARPPGPPSHPPPP